MPGILVRLDTTPGKSQVWCHHLLNKSPHLSWGAWKAPEGCEHLAR